MNSAVRAVPICMKPVGEGAMRVTTGRSVEVSAISAPVNVSETIGGKTRPVTTGLAREKTRVLGSAPLGRLFDEQRGSLILWTPVLYGIGIAMYLGLAREPGAALWAGIGGLAVAVVIVLRRRGLEAVPAIAILFLLAGFTAAAVRTHAVADPVLGFRY